MTKTAWLCAAALSAVLAGTMEPALAHPSPAASPAAQPPTADLTQAPRMGTWGFDLAGRDLAAKPGDNFFRYANGAATDKLVIPPDRARFGTFDALRELSDARSNQVIQAARASNDPDARKIVALYDSFMDQAALDALGAKPLAGELDAIAKARTRADLARLMGLGTKGFYGSFFGAFISDDAKDPKHYAVYLSQAGLGLPDRDYYLTPGFEDKKAKYQAYVADTLKRLNWPEAERRARQIVELETAVAKVSWTKVEQRDDEKSYNPSSVGDLVKAAPGFPWRAFLKAADLATVDRVIVSEKSAFPKIAAIYAKTPIPVLKAWQAFTLTDNASSYLSKTFDEPHFAFRGTALSGAPQQRPRWKRASTLVGGQLGEALGRLYVQSYFPPESKAKMLALVGDLKTALGARIQNVDWMSPQTKQQALEKLSKLTVKIGYPDKWRDYSDLRIEPGDLYGNVERAMAFEWAFHRGRLGGPVDRAEWLMFPQTVNAYYNPPKNEIVFPAAILQPPFFDPQADPAVNYGAIGGVIGHEMTHGFDDQGRKYDGDGVLRDWWTKEDADRFDARAKALSKQYSAFEPLPGAHINGDLTLGENIADLGGLLLALDAYHASLKDQPSPVIDGLTGDQRVFLGWSQSWRGKSRDDALRQQLASDPHSPGEFRVSGVVRNVNAWYDAWDVKSGEKLYVSPDQRVHIW